MESDQIKNIDKVVTQRNNEFNKNCNKAHLKDTFQLKLNTAFGINSNPICNQLQIVGQKYVIFMVGNIIAIKDILEKTQQFFTYPNHFCNVTALFGVSKQLKSRQKSKKADKQPYLPNIIPIKIYIGQSSQNSQKCANIISLKPYRNRLRVMNTGIKGIIKQMTIDRNKKMVGCLIHSIQNQYIVIFNYRKEKLLTSTNLKTLSIQNISIHPLKQKSVILMGKNYLRMWELHPQEEILKEDQQLVSLKTQKQNKFYDFSWQTNQKNPILFVLTNKNAILLIQNDTLVHTINLTDPNQLFAIRATKRGFCVGGSNRSLSIYQLDKTYIPNLIIGGSSKQGEKPQQLKTHGKSDSILNNGDIEDRIIKIYSSINDGIFTVAATNQLGAFNFYYLNSLRIDADISSLDQFFSSGFHNKKINCLSRSVTKQLLASCSADNTVKIWNFFDVQGYEKRGLLSQRFHQQPLSVSMHPSGLFLAVSFCSMFKVFAIVNNSLQALKQIQIPNCKIIKYSHGGHFLAVNEKQHIFIYDSIYYETLHLFSLSNTVQDIAISNDDTQIVATCMSGYVYCFNLYDSLHCKNYQNKKGYQHKQNTTYTCIGYDNKINNVINDKQKNDKISVQRDKADSNLFIGCTIQKYMVLYKNKCKDLIAQFPIVDCHIISLLICSNQGLLIAGTSKGSLRVYNWPLTQKNLEMQTFISNGIKKIKLKQPQYVQINAHSYPVVSITCSHDQNYLFSGSQDGTIFCFSLASFVQKQKKDGYCLIKPEDRKRIAQSSNDLYLEKVQRIQQKNETIQKLKFQILRSEKKLKLQKQKLEIIYKQKMDTLKKEYKITLQTNKKIKQSYIQNATKQYIQLNDRLKTEKKKYEDEIQKIRKIHKEKIQYEVKRNQNLKKDIQQLQKKHTQQMQKISNEHKQKMKNTKFLFYQKCHKLQIKYSNFLNQSKKHSQQFKQELDKKQKQNDQQIQQQIKQKKQQILKVKAINLQLQQKNKKLKQQFTQLQHQDQLQQQTFQKLFKQHNTIRYQNLKSDQDILKMQHQLLQRLQVIQSKQQTCKNTKYQQITLQNFRYMLDNKIQNEQKKKNEMISKIKLRQNDLKNMFNELIKQSEDNEKKSFELKQLNNQIQVLQNQIKKSQDQIQLNQNKYKYFKTQVSSITNSSQDVRIIGKKLKKLIQQCDNDVKDFNHGYQQSNNQNQSLKQVNQQLTRQAKYMEKKLKMVKDISENYKQMRQENINSVLAQNTKLIQQCNKLRSLNDQYKRNIQQYQKQLNDLLRKKQKSNLIKKQQDSFNLKGINKKLKQNQIKINDQHQKLTNMTQQAKNLLHHKSESKLPNLKNNKPK